MVPHIAASSAGSGPVATRMLSRASSSVLMPAVCGLVRVFSHGCLRWWCMSLPRRKRGVVEFGALIISGTGILPDGQLWARVLNAPSSTYQMMRQARKMDIVQEKDPQGGFLFNGTAKVHHCQGNPLRYKYANLHMARASVQMHQCDDRCKRALGVRPRSRGALQRILSWHTRILHAAAKWSWLGSPGRI